MCFAPNCGNSLSLLVKFQFSFAFSGLFTLVSLYLFSTIVVSYLARNVRRKSRLILSSVLFGVHYLAITFGYFIRLAEDFFIFPENLKFEVHESTAIYSIFLVAGLIFVPLIEHYVEKFWTNKMR